MRLFDRGLNCCNLTGYRLFYCDLETKAVGSIIYVFDASKCQLKLILMDVRMFG